MEIGFSITDALRVAYENMTRVEIWAVMAGLIYVILAAGENIWCWLFGIINSLLSIYLFYTGKLYSEAILYVYYVMAGVYGWYAWGQKNKNNIQVLDPSDAEKKDLKIHTWSVNSHLKAIAAGIAGAFLLAYLMAVYTDAKIPLMDAFTTIFSFIATYMVTRKVLENWLYWIVVDIVTTGMYYGRGYYLYAVLMIVYTVIAVFGYLKWRERYKKASATS